MEILGIIPARGGSKGVKRKNIRTVAGLPLISYAIRSAQESRYLSYFLTSTDDEEIANIARQYESPVIIRPDELAQDETPMVPVILHALENAENNNGRKYDVIIVLQPSAPIRKGIDIDNVIKMFEKDSKVECVISVCPMEDLNPARMYKIEEEGWMNPIWPNWETNQRQDLPTVYIRNGAIYAVKKSILKEQHTLMSKNKKAYIMPRKLWAPIDDERDLVIADLLVSLWKENKL